MAHFFKPLSNELEEDEKITTGYPSKQANMLVSLNSDGRICLEFYKEQDGNRETLKQIVFDKKESQKLYKFLVREVSLV